MATTKKTSTKTTIAKKTAGKVVAAEQLTLVDALPVAAEPPAAAAPAPKKSELEKAAPAPAPVPAPVEDKPRRTEDMGPQKVRAALHPEHNSRGRGRSEAEKRESYARYRANKKKAMELEERNTRHLILFPASDADTNAEKFYNMGGNSAIILLSRTGTTTEAQSGSAPRYGPGTGPVSQRGLFNLQPGVADPAAGGDWGEAATGLRRVGDF